MWVVFLDSCKPFLCKSKLYLLERVESIFLNIWTKFHKPLTSFVEQLGNLRFKPWQQSSFIALKWKFSKICCANKNTQKLYNWAYFTVHCVILKAADFFNKVCEVFPTVLCCLCIIIVLSFPPIVCCLCHVFSFLLDSHPSISVKPLPPPTPYHMVESGQERGLVSGDILKAMTVQCPSLIFQTSWQSYLVLSASYRSIPAMC